MGCLAILVCAGKPAIADDITRQDRSNLPDFVAGPKHGGRNFVLL